MASHSVQALVHELHVHQVELEQQNEELRRTQGDLAIARDRFEDLFDFAPVGYLTLDRQGHVREANLTMATELGVERRAILGRQFTSFIAPSDRDRWQRLKALALQRGRLRSIELSLCRMDGEQFHVQLDCVLVARPDADPQLRVAVADISLRKLAERNRRIASSANDARESERRNVAYKLHEDLGQRLSALKMSLSMLLPPATAASIQAVVGAMGSEIDQALAIVRRMSTELHPLMLENLGLNAALEWLARDAASRVNATVTLHLDDIDPPLDPSSAIAVYRLTELALKSFGLRRNADIDIELLNRPDDVVLQLQRAWVPTRHPPAPGNRSAVASALADQVHLLGGRMELGEQPSGVRRLTIRLPVVRAQAH